MRYHGEVTIHVIDEDGTMVDLVSTNDLTSYGMKTLFSNLVGQTQRKFDSVSLGYNASPDCTDWQSQTPIEFADISTPVFTSIKLHSAGPILSGTAETYELSFSVLRDEGNGVPFNMLGLTLDDGKLFAVTKVPKITKSDRYTLVVKWSISVEKETDDRYITTDGLGMFIGNMLPSSTGGVVDTISYENDGFEVGSGALLANIGNVLFENGYSSLNVELITTISVPGDYTCDKIIVKAGSATFAEVDFGDKEWTFSNISEEKLRMNNGVKWDITISEELECKG